MPIYEWHCPYCSKDFETISKPMAPAECPECRTKDCIRLISSHSNYEIKGDNSASTRPKGGGSPKAQ